MTFDMSKGEGERDGREKGLDLKEVVAFRVRRFRGAYVDAVLMVVAAAEKSTIVDIDRNAHLRSEV